MEMRRGALEIGVSCNLHYRRTFVVRKAFEVLRMSSTVLYVIALKLKHIVRTN